MKHRKPRKDGRYIINVSFLPTETSLITWADGHGNFSNYVKKLIEQDMKKDTMQGETLQTLLGDMLGKEVLKNIFQNTADSNEVKEEVAVAEESPKANKSKALNIMKNLNKK